jgi:hypothetical protein
VQARHHMFDVFEAGFQTPEASNCEHQTRGMPMTGL